MASASKIKEGLLHIIWDATYTPSDDFHGFHKVGQNTGKTGNPTQTQVNVSTLTDVVDSFILTCKTEGQQIVLEIEILSRIGKNHTKQIDLETILIHATKDREQQKMTLNQSKLTAMWDASIIFGCRRCITPIRCNYCGKENPLIFHILIDLTPNSVISSKNGTQHVLDHLLTLWNTKTLSDVTFNCQGKSIKAHTLILASGSPVLAAMFQLNLRENQEKVVEINDINPEVFEELLCYIYTGNFNSGRNVDAAELFVAADKYSVETLKEECALVLSRKLKVGNAAQYLVLSYDHYSPKLYEASIDFITKNAKAVCSRKDWMTIIKNYPEICFQVTQLMLSV
ncbi:TD and POZ domain-containing protein 1-like [Daphnia pulex]|uniref:TD and POZ domain-containing protein 1-like n=1 Tax=Daphnia pulex TaxID=6669 RepID=UPI001EDF5DEB|nr:TD and POZ domain-containing protein 1-like [Daphnia pulex]